MSENPVIRALNNEINSLMNKKDDKKTIQDLKNSLTNRFNFFVEESILLYQKEHDDKEDTETKYNEIVESFVEFLNDYSDNFWFFVPNNDKNIIFQETANKELNILEIMKENILKEIEGKND